MIFSSTMVRLFGPLANQGLRALADWLFRRGPRALRIAAVVSLAVFLLGGIWWWWDATAIQEISIQALRAPLEETAQSYKGLEAFALAGLEDDVNASFRAAKVTPEFARVFADFEATLSRASDLRQISKLRVVRPGPGQELAGAYLSDGLARDSKHGFLFLPAMILRVASNAPSDVAIETAAAGDSQVLKEINASQSISEALCGFTAIPVLHTEQASSLAEAEQPVQSYFITRTGLLRICAANVVNQEKYYEPQFRPSSFFPERPYFWATINSSSLTSHLDANTAVAESFHLTAPYVDLGGNGVVVTMARRLPVAGLTENALFLDISLGSLAEKTITEKVKRLGGTAIQTTCNVQGCSSGLTGEERALVNKVVARLGTPANLSEIFGKIHVFQEKAGGRIVFTIPLARYYAAQEGQWSLLFCTIDLQQLHLVSALKAAAAGGGFLLFIFFVAALIADFGLRLREQERAFRTFAAVMEDAPIAYCRLSGEDKFLDINKAFVSMLGYGSEELALKELGRFNDLLADDDSRRRYERIEANRRGVAAEHVESEPYPLTLWDATRSQKIDVMVYASAVPEPLGVHQAPQTFGILLRR